MPIRDVFKLSRKTFFDPSSWIGVQSLQLQNRSIWVVLKALFSTAKPEREETFEQAQQRLQLLEQDVQSGAINYRYYALMFLVIGLLVLFYSFYLLFHHKTILSWLLGLATSGLFFAQAFQYDFWALQMRRRTLGLTLADWLNTVLGGKGKT